MRASGNQLDVLLRMIRNSKLMVKNAGAALLVVAKNVSVAGVLVGDILYIFAVCHVKGATRALYVGKIVGKLGYFLAVRAADLHIYRIASKV